jgi:hypothetical protein
MRSMMAEWLEIMRHRGIQEERMNVLLKGVSREEVRELIEQGGTPWVSFFLAPYPPGETLQRAVQLENLLRRAEAELEIKLIDTVDLEGGPGTSFCSL